MDAVAFLSDEWIAALDDAARARVAPDDDPLSGVRLTIEQRVDPADPATDDPGEELRWRVAIDDGAVRVGRGDGEEADVRLRCARDVAAAIAAGQRPALDAFIAGDLTIGGDVGALIANGGALAAVGGLFAAVAERTRF